MIYLKSKAVKKKFNSAQKQINKEATEVLDRHINTIIEKIIANNPAKRITEKNIQL